jgi:hypothetical protein
MDRIASRRLSSLTPNTNRALPTALLNLHGDFMTKTKKPYNELKRELAKHVERLVELTREIQEHPDAPDDVKVKPEPKPKREPNPFPRSL